MNEIETLILRIIGENVDSPDVFTDTESGMAPIRDSVNSAIEEISMLSGGYKGDYNLPLEANKSFYRLHFTHDAIGWVTDAWLVDQKRRLEQTDLIRLNNHNPRWMENTGSPYAYLPVGINVIGFWPKPSGDNDVVDITCVMIPGRYTSGTDRIKMRENYKWAAVHFSVGEFYASRGDAKMAIYHHTQYLDRLGLRNQYPETSEHVRHYQTGKDIWPKATD